MCVGGGGMGIVCGRGWMAVRLLTAFLMIPSSGYTGSLSVEEERMSFIGQRLAKEISKVCQRALNPIGNLVRVSYASSDRQCVCVGLAYSLCAKDVMNMLRMSCLHSQCSIHVVPMPFIPL